MSDAIARSLPVTQTTPRTKPVAPASAADAWPFNLKLLLFVLAAFGVNIAVVVYLAGQMPH